jgi:polysaccharide biosynthesis transport protein
MNFSQFVRILRVHAGLIFATLIVVVGIAAIVSLMMPRQYSASSSIVIDYRGNNPVALSPMPAQLYPSYLATQLDIISSQNVALKVVDDLNLLEDRKARARYLPNTGVFSGYMADWREKAYNTPPSWLPTVVSDLLFGEREDATTEAQAQKDSTLMRHRLAEQLLKRLELKPSRDSSMVKVGYRASDPNAAAEGANAFVNAYIATSLEMSVNPARDSSVWFNDQTKILASNVAKARAKYSEYQQQSGIVAPEEHLDVESSRLVELSSRLVETQADNHPALQALKADVSRAEARLNSLPPQFGTNHPQYRSAQEEVSILRNKLLQQTQQITGSIQGQISTQRSKVLQMKKQRAELATLKNEVDSAQRILDDAMQRSNQVRMESQINQTNVSVLKEAVPPLRPASPNLPLNVALAAFAASVLAVGLALWRELAYRYVRCKEDLKGLLGVPILGILPSSGGASVQPHGLRQHSAARLTFNN